MFIGVYPAFISARQAGVHLISEGFGRRVFLENLSFLAILPVAAAINRPAAVIWRLTDAISQPADAIWRLAVVKKRQHEVIRQLSDAI